jgi:hypothetical protein
VKRSGRDEPMWDVTHMSMEEMLGISLYSYLYSYVFASTKLENKMAEQVLP